jgi:hypothetical protein
MKVKTVKRNRDGLSHWLGRCTCFLLSSAVVYLGGRLPAAAEDLHAVAPPPPTLSQLQETLLNLQRLPPVLFPTPEDLAAGIAVTQQTVSGTSPTIPSLWWAQAQLDGLLGNELILTWVAYRRLDEGSIPRIDVAVNGPLWGKLDYLDQYAFISQFGQTAKSYGYQLRVFAGDRITGAYICDFARLPGESPQQLPDAASLNQIPCLISLDYRGAGSIRGRLVDSSANGFQQP